MPSTANESDQVDDAPVEADEADEASNTQIGLLEAKQVVLDNVGDLLDHPVEGVIKVNRTTDSDWRVVLEVVERKAVPDTQDMLGRYEFTVDSSGNLSGYNLVERYHRGDSKDEL